MSLYNMVFRQGLAAPWILQALRCPPRSFGRYRDAFLREEEEHGLVMVIHTRCGGGNREEYEEVFEDAREHDLYLYDRDCEYDSTYADIVFKAPDGFLDQILKEGVEAMMDSDRCADMTEEQIREMIRENLIENQTQEEKWKAAMDAIAKGK